MKKLLSIFLICNSLNVNSQTCDIPEHSIPDHTGSNMILFVTAPVVSYISDLIQSSNPYIVAVYESGQVIGCDYFYDVFTSGQGSIALWGDDWTTPEIEGPSGMEQIYFQLIDGQNIYSLVFQDEVLYSTNSVYYALEASLSQIVCGCTDPSYCNYSVEANQNDGSCSGIMGCTDSSYAEYNSLASCQLTGSCINTVNDAYYNLLQSSEVTNSNFSLLQTQTLDLLSLIDSLASPVVIDLIEGWNLIGYTEKTPILVDVALEDIVESVYLIKNNAAKVYWPEFGFNGIGDLIPGQGYQIKMNESIESFTFQYSQLNIYEYIQYQIFQPGDLAFGGIVFYVDETGQHGLVAAMEDLGQFEWGCYGTDIAGANGQAIGTGYQNTLDIVAGCSETPIAASEALAYQSGGYSDWYIPSKDELVEMYNTIGNGGPEGNIGGFSSDRYLSSSENSNINAWSVYFINGLTNYDFKYIHDRVRVIRAF